MVLLEQGKDTQHYHMWYSWSKERIHNIITCGTPGARKGYTTLSHVVLLEQGKNTQHYHMWYSCSKERLHNIITCGTPGARKDYTTFSHVVLLEQGKDTKPFHWLLVKCTATSQNELSCDCHVPYKHFDIRGNCAEY